MSPAQNFTGASLVCLFRNPVPLNQPCKPQATDKMKRKLDENDEPSVVAEADKTGESQPETEAEPTFADLGLDPRLIQAVAKQAFQKPTLVQHKAIPLAIDGKDVLAKAKTGSGKTAAYVLPILQAVLKRKQVQYPLPRLIDNQILAANPRFRPTTHRLPPL